MRLTALRVCGILLAFSTLSWTTTDSDEGNVLGDHGFGPCTATLRPEGLCRHGQDENTCPYLFSLPPLTLHLPNQLRELEQIVKDLQKLKDNVDQLRKMCADCTVSQTERECGRQRERQHEKLNEGTDRHEDERNWLNERKPDRPKEFGPQCGTDRVKAEKITEGDGDTDSEKRTILEEKDRKKWEAERGSDKGVVKENEREETLKEMSENYGKTKTEGAKGKDKLGQAKVQTAGGNERTVDIINKNVVEKNNKEIETDRNKDKDGKGNSKRDPEDKLESGKEREITSNVKNKEKTEESDHHVRQHETKETGKKTQTEADRGSDGIKMSEDHDEHTNKERKQHGEERKKEMEKGIKVERNNEKPKQTESIGRAEKETIKEGEEEDGEAGREIKTEREKTVQSVQRDSDGELASSKATERTDFVSISPTPHPIISLTPGHDSMDSNEATTFTSFLPSPPLSSPTSHLVTDANQGMTIVDDGLPTQSAGLGAAGISEQPRPDGKEGFRTTSMPTTTATINTLGGPGQQITRATDGFTSTTRARPGAGFQGRVSLTTATITPRQNLYTTTFPGVADRGRWTAKKNISSNTKTGMKPPPGRGPKPGEKHKPAIKPDADQKLKNPKNDRKPGGAPLPDRKTKHDQKQKPSHQKPTTERKSKPGKDPKRVQVPKPDQRPRPDHLETDQNLKNNKIPKHDQEHTTDQSQLPVQKPKTHQKAMPPVHRPAPHQRPQTVNATGSGKDPRTDRETESVEKPIITKPSKPGKKPDHPLTTDKLDQTQKPHKKPKVEEKPKPDQGSRINQYFTPEQEPEPETSEPTSFTPKSNQKPKPDQGSRINQYFTPEQEPEPETSEPTSFTPKSNQKLKPDQGSRINQYFTPEQEPEPETSEPTSFTPKSNQKPKPDQGSRINQYFTPEQEPEPETSEPTSFTPKSNQKPKPDQKLKPDQGSAIDQYFTPDQEPEPETSEPTRSTPKSNQKPKPDQGSRINQYFTPEQEPEPETSEPTSFTPKSNQKLKPDQGSRINQYFTPDQEPEPETSEPTSFTPKSNQKLKPDQGSRINQYFTPEQEPEPETSEPTSFTPKSNQKPKPDQKLKPDQGSTIDQYFTPDQEPEPETSEPTGFTPMSNQKPKPERGSAINQYFTPDQEPDPETSEPTSFTPKSNQKPQTELKEKSDENPKSVKDSTPGQKLTPDRGPIKRPDQNPKPSQKFPKTNQRPKPNQKHPELVTGQKTKPNMKPKPPQTNQGIRTPRPVQMPDLNPKSVRDEIPEAQSNKTSKPRPPPRHRPPTRPTLRPGATPLQRPKPAVQLEPSPKTKTDVDPLQISGTDSNNIQAFQTDMPPAPGPATQIGEVTHAPGVTEFSPSTMKTITAGPKTSNSLETGPFPRPHTLSEGFTMSPNSRITSDLRPQTASQPPSIPMTTKPNKIIHGILPSVIPSTSPKSTKPNLASNTDSSLLHSVEVAAPTQTPYPDKMMIPVPTRSAQTTSTISPDLRSTTPATSGPEPPAVESSTPSARELRVKINQVAAFLNNSLTPNGRPPDRRPKEHLGDNKGGSRPENKVPAVKPSKVTMPRDCSDHLLRGETRSRVYLVTPDLRSRSFPVLCDMELNGGGWTLLQRRQDGSVSFNRTWAEYRAGFGELDGGEFWLGNNMIHLLTRDRDMVLRVELEDFEGVMEYAEYEHFRVASERLRYRLSVGGYSGTAGDALRFSKQYDHNNRAFTTPDRDNDRYPSGNCGAYYSSGWWFDACLAANLNGKYYAGRYKGVRDGIYWGTWHNISTEFYPTNDRQSFKKVRMMIRPKGFAP
ncbi:proline-rich protein 36-like [Epinephelus fuscoguttatus]|uniref:proline-rich protein 36-like n=1 Tax=Epinephelus fuscoguttatus TaxID=293821 RepID=UPI0020D0A83B|nr:proline-rich protein 36-like [Epinephelus fuscoguttatus]